MRVLLVDDEAAILSALQRLFVRRGHEVRTVTSGAAAIKLLDEFAPDLVVSDFHMPGLDGLAVLDIVAAQYPNARRVLLTGFAPPTRPVGALMFDKPYKSQELLCACGA
ncbi:MAG TPA: response regulator [Kofleriaceae bacterium]|jgi:CheY-like chemotaxis protein